MENRDKETENLTQKKIIGALVYGIIINLILLSILDFFDKSKECAMRNQNGDGGVCTIYPLLLLISLLLGWLASVVFNKIDNYNHKNKKI